jgi:1-acyl-sn-glycerol-3-phosphate acyltransferase
MNAFGRFQHWLVRRALRRSFAAFRCAAPAAAPPPDRPLILCPTHANWWDGFAAAALARRFFPERGFWLAQEARHLDRYPWFRHAGVIGLDLATPAAARRGLRALRACLADPAALLVYFPEGVMRLQDQGPLPLRRGVGWLARESGATLLPLALKYGFRDGSRPEIRAAFGTPLAATGGDPVPALQSALAGLTAVLDAHWLDPASPPPPPLWPPRPPAGAGLWSRAASRLLGGG